MLTVFAEINDKLDRKQETTKNSGTVDLEKTNVTAGNKKYNN